MVLTALMTVPVWAAQESVHPLGGSSVPWPWPWAEDCRIDYESLNATFVVKNSEVVHFIQISTSRNPQYLYRYLRIRLYNANFDLLSEGETYVDENSRSVFVKMTSISSLNVPGLKLRIYYKSESTSCEISNLIPILTVMEGSETQKANTDQMILEPMSDLGQESP